MLKIPAKIEYVIEALNCCGYEAYIVGGCVRDMLLGKTPSDFDITTSATPTQVQSLFPKTIPTGLKHGTVTVLVDSEPIEVTTFRTEGAYLDSRRPESVQFVTSLKEDLARRDFTINAMAYNKSTGVVDCFGGRKDLENGILRTVGNPEARFCEDALRILRLFRFASVLDFTPEQNTLYAALKLSSNLQKISSERIFTELKKAICGKNLNTLAPLINCGGLSFLSISKCPDFKAIESFKDNFELAFFSFVYLSQSNVMETLDKLKVSNSLKNYCKTLLKLIDICTPESKEDIKLILSDCDTEIFRDYLLFRKKVYNKDVAKSEALLLDIIKNNEPYLISHLAINGDTLGRLGFKGKEIGLTLDSLRKTVIKNPKMNTKENLLKHLEIY